MDLDINIFLRITPITYDNVFEVFLNQIYNLDSAVPPLNPEQKELRIQKLKNQCSLYITRLAIVRHIYRDLATNVINNHYVLRDSFIREALYADPDRRFATDSTMREQAIREQAKLRVIRMGFLLKVINEWNSLQAGEKKNIMESFSTSLNQLGSLNQIGTDPYSDVELEAGSVLGPEEGRESLENIRQPLRNISNTSNRGGFKYTSRNKKKKQKKSKKIRKKSKKRIKKSKHKRKKKKTRTN